MKKLLFSLAGLALLTAFSFATFQTNGYQVGDIAADFKLKNIDGKMVSMADYKDAKGFIVIFSCNHCPFVVASEDRMIALHEKYASKGYPVIAINPNEQTHADDTFEKMKVRAQEKGFKFAYLVDGEQKYAKLYGATKTPDVFLLNKEKKDGKEVLIVRYKGAIDNSVRDASAVTETFLADALEALLAGKPISKTDTKAVGCSIKWKETR
ncbi:MAG: thioredoxin family protein [Microscillaceae bacterium]